MAALCISMHQPWASLLVHGIKRVEGRGWPTEHRGTLWVYATAQTPEPDVVAVRCPARQCILTLFAQRMERALSHLSWIHPAACPRRSMTAH